MSTMRAKMEVTQVSAPYEGAEQIKFSAVSGSFGPAGESEDNTYARYTPCGTLDITVNNPNLLGKFTAGQKFYLDFTAA